jgi:hypothetical protein
LTTNKQHSLQPHQQVTDRSLLLRTNDSTVVYINTNTQGQPTNQPTTMDFERAATPVSVDRSRRSVQSNRTTSLNDKLNTDYIDLGGAEPDGIQAQATKTVAGWIGDVVTPRQLLIVLRVLKAVTLCFLVLTLAADLMYIIFLEVLATREVRDIVGGRRDMIIRVYGLFLACVAIAIEIDVALVVKSFYGFKGFVPRAALLFFIAAITGAHPLQEDQLQGNKAYAEWLSSHNNNNNYYDDAAAADAAGDDGAAAGDDAAIVYDDMFYLESNPVPDIPDSVIVFQMVTSFIL